ncbi:MAG TPA: DUF512 domain-containing protein [Acidobacteriota bacterium]|jgi:putative radical SAM enzyme (TIGR03279 family)
MGVRITQVEERSIAAELGIHANDEIVSINDRPIRDIIDYRFHSSQDSFVLRLKKPGQNGDQLWDLDLELEGEDLGLEIEDFKNKGCNNKCVFCFIDQLPDSARVAMKFRDDDFRLSFLHGNYITLTNMRIKEIERVVEQRLSPLYVSVHATDLAVRNRMLGRADDGGFWEKFERLVNGGITLHTQVVLCPTYNDGPILKQTIFDLYRYYPGVATVSIVPLGLSKHRAASDGLVAVTPEFCKQVIDQVTPYQEDFRRRSGATFVHLADEFYLVTGRPIPPAAHYGEFPLTEDGIGMVRLFARDFQHNLKVLGAGNGSGKKKRAAVKSSFAAREGTGSAIFGRLRGSIATSTLFEESLRRHIDCLNLETGSRLEVFSVPNAFLGESITVAGLLAGRDIAAEARQKMSGGFLIVPSEAVSNSSRLFIDGYTTARISEEAGIPVFEGGLTVDSFFDLLQKLSCECGMQNAECGICKT